jgi:hypothetical protein
MCSCTLSLTSALDGGGWSTPHRLRFTPGKETREGVRTGVDGGVVYSRTVQPVASRYTD